MVFFSVCSEICALIIYLKLIKQILFVWLVNKLFKKLSELIKFRKQKMIRYMYLRHSKIQNL